MEVDRPVVRTTRCKRVVLWVNQELKDIADTYAAVIRFGAQSKPLPRKVETRQSPGTLNLCRAGALV